MSFTIEILSDEQRKEFALWNLKEPILGFGRIIRVVDMYPPSEWTIDRERKIYLIGSSCDWDYPDERVFIFIWNGIDYLVQFHQSFKDDNTIVWSPPQKNLINRAFPYCTEEKFVDDLREALTAYGAFGTVVDPRLKCNVEFSF